MGTVAPPAGKQTQGLWVILGITPKDPVPLTPVNQATHPVSDGKGSFIGP